LAQHPGSVVQDRSVYEDAEIFAQNLYLQGYLKARDYETYRELYETAVQLLPPPDLLIYLRASVPTLMGRISHRGREYERSITPEYLEGLNTLYETWISNFVLCPVLTIPADDLDYVAHSGHLNLIASKVEEKLIGNEEVVFEDEEVARAAHG
jgi:deoxyadenosine/deoxycytidine kinase